MLSLFNKCPEGTVKIKGYTRKSGKIVKSYCSERTKTRKTECPPGKIPRASYVRHITSRVKKEGYTRKTKSGKIITVYPKSNSVLVKPTCISDPQKIGPLKKGELKKYGYGYKLPDAKRRAALQRAVSKLGALNVFHKLDAVAKLSKTAAPLASSVFFKDRDWIRKMYAGPNGILQAF